MSVNTRVVVSVLALAAACGEVSHDEPQAGGGSHATSGGKNSSGGGRAGATSGGRDSGGAATGGTNDGGTGTGGASSGGTITQGGAPTAGAAGSAGASNTGGTSVEGGATSSGGSSTGGVIGPGGAPVTGGAAGDGGRAPEGGANAGGASGSAGGGGESHGPVVDETNLTEAVDWAAIADATQAPGQSFPIQTSGQLAGIEVAPSLRYGATAEHSIRLVLYRCASFSDCSGAPIGSVTLSGALFNQSYPTLVPGAPGIGYFDLTLLGVQVTAGEYFRFDLVGDLETYPDGGSPGFGISANGVYPRGNTYLNGAPMSPAPFIRFVSYVIP